MYIAKRIPVSQASITGNELKYVTDAITRGWVSSSGDYIEKFEQKFAEYIGTKYAVACSSGTTALTLALRALGIKEGDEVIVPDFTMIASAWAVTYTGAKPVFVDCGDDLNIDVELIEAAITPKTKAIMPVHIYGRPCNMEKIMEIAREYNLFVVEDACEAHGAYITGKKVGSFGDANCFSFFGNKIITSGEGGMITTDSERTYWQLKHLRAMAFDPKHTFLHKKVGYNFRMSNLEAAFGLAQLEQIDEKIAKRAQIRDWYDEKLKHLTIPRPEGSVLWYYDIFFENEEARDACIKRLDAAGIDWRYVFKPMHAQPMYKRDSFFDFPFSIPGKGDDAAKKGLYLPTFPDMTKEMVNEICEIILAL